MSEQWKGHIKKSRFVLLTIGLLAGLPSVTRSSLAGPITLTVSNAANYILRPGENSRSVQVQIGTYKVAPILVPPKTPADTKAGLIYGALVGLPVQAGFPYPNMTVSKQVGKPAVTIDGLPKGITVDFSPNSTGEKRDTLTVALASGEAGAAELGFQNDAFASTDADGNDSVFTAGVITDVGELSFTIDESTLPDLKGSTIVAALYDDLADRGNIRRGKEARSQTRRGKDCLAYFRDHRTHCPKPILKAFPSVLCFAV